MIQKGLIKSSELNPHISVDCVVFGFDSDSLKVLIIQRDQLVKEDPEKKVFALPL